MRVSAVRLATGPDFGAAGPQLHDGVDRLHRRVRQIGEREFGLQHLRGLFKGSGGISSPRGIEPSPRSEPAVLLEDLGMLSAALPRWYPK